MKKNNCKTVMGFPRFILEEKRVGETTYYTAHSLEHEVMGYGMTPYEAEQRALEIVITSFSDDFLPYSMRN